MFPVLYTMLLFSYNYYYITVVPPSSPPLCFSIQSYSRNKSFIAAQAPLESTKNDVWEMIWQFRPSAVVVLSNCKNDKVTLADCLLQ